MLWVLAFGMLYFVFVRAAGISKNYRLIGLAAFLVFLVGSTWNMLRNEKNRREYSKSEGVSPKLPSQWRR
jgi:hypothetical protein